MERMAAEGMIGAVGGLPSLGILVVYDAIWRSKHLALADKEKKWLPNFHHSSVPNYLKSEIDDLERFPEGVDGDAFGDFVVARLIVVDGERALAAVPAVHDLTVGTKPEVVVGSELT